LVGNSWKFMSGFKVWIINAVSMSFSWEKFLT
jgi:hypothetical protein